MGPQAREPWLASSTALWSWTKGRTLSGTSSVEGMAKSATGTSPRPAIISVRYRSFRGMRQMAKAVEKVGCAWTTLCTSGRSRSTIRCMGLSEEGQRSPSMTLPSRSQTTSISGSIRPLDTPEGVSSTRFSPTRRDTLPSLLTT